MKIGKYLTDIMQLDPQAPALEFEGHWWTWRDIETVIQRTNDLLGQCGMGAGTRVGLLLRNCPPQLCAMLALLISRRRIVTINPIQPAESIKRDLLELDLPAVIAGRKDWALPALQEAARQVKFAAISIAEDGADLLQGPTMQPPPSSPDDICIEMLTSGTTGRPKRIPLERNKLESGLIGAMRMERDRDPEAPPRLRAGAHFLVYPLSHISGVFNTLNTFLAGRQLILADRFTVEGWVDAVRRHRLKVAGGPPAALKMILEAEIPAADLSSLAAIVTGTAPLAPEIVDAFLDRYDIPVLNTYGATEFAGGVASWSVSEFRRLWAEKHGSVGRVNDNVLVRTADPDGLQELPLGEAGLLEIRGAQIGDGKSWVRTTDMARLDEDGFLYILGRADGAIIRGGFKIMPEDVEKALEAHPAVREACVIGIDDERLGAVPAAAIILARDCKKPSDKALANWVKQRLAAYAAPVRYLVVEQLPRTSSMKVSIPELKRLFGNAGRSR